MKKIFLIIAPIILFQVKTIYSQSLSTNPNFDLVYSDEFNNLNNWSIIDENIPSGTTFGSFWSNSSNNVSVNNGIVTLTTSRTPNTTIFRKGKIQSKTWSTIPLLPDFFVEIRAKFKNGYNASPALWLWGGDGGCNPGGWCMYREMDFLEFWGKEQLTSGGIHYCADIVNNTQCHRYGTQGTENAENRFAIYNQENFNLYGGRWNKNILTITFNNTEHVRKPPPNVPFQTNNVPLAFVMNSEIRCWTLEKCTEDFSNFPYTLDVDYLRLYTIKKQCTQVITQITNFSTFNYGLKKSITLGANTTVPANQTYYLYATDFIQLNDGFSIPTGTDFTFGLFDCGN